MTKSVDVSSSVSSSINGPLPRLSHSHRNTSEWTLRTRQSPCSHWHNLHRQSIEPFQHSFLERPDWTVHATFDTVSASRSFDWRENARRNNFERCVLQWFAEFLSRCEEIPIRSQIKHRRPSMSHQRMRTQCEDCLSGQTELWNANENVTGRRTREKTYFRRKNRTEIS